MRRLVVTALSEDVLAAPENREANHIVVSVTDEGERPLGGLTSNDFIVKPMIVAPQGSTISHLMRAAESDVPGVYILEIMPDEKSVWKLGTCIFAIAVQSGFSRGTDSRQRLDRLTIWLSVLL